ncbi:MAG: YidC/Oxa1 family membrane protein insertase [Armatimonas sp.]
MKPRLRLLLAALLLMLIPFGTGCGPRYQIPNEPAAALAEGAKKEELAQKAEEAKSTQAAQNWTEAATFYAQTAGQFPTQAEGMQAGLKAADLYTDKVKNPHQGWITVRNLLRQNPTSELPEKKQLEEKRLALETRMDRDNASAGWHFNLFGLPVHISFYHAMDLLVRICGNNPTWSPVVAVFILSVLVAGMLWPLQKMQYQSFKELAKYQPELKKLQDKYKGDQLLLSQKMKEFYAEHGIKPTAGCLPMFVQMGITLVMLQLVWTYQFRFSQSHFLWINPLAGATSLTWPGFFKGIIGHNLGELDIPMLLLYAGSQFAQAKLIPPPTDPTQAEVQKTMTTFMPVFYFFIMLQNQMPSALMLYYFTSTLLGMWRQWTLNRQFPRDASAGPVIISASDDEATENTELKANPKLIAPKGGKRGGKK